MSRKSVEMVFYSAPFLDGKFIGINHGLIKLQTSENAKGSSIVENK